MRRLNPRVAWVSLFCVINLVCGIVIYCTRKLLGEASSLSLEHRGVVPWITLLLILSYIVPLLIVFPLFSKIKIHPIRYSKHDLGNAVGVLCLILQLAYIAFFLATGTGVAGSMNRSDSSFSIFWVLLNQDSLFFIYYGFYRSKRMFWPILVVSIISNLLRGWNGIFIVILFMESCHLMRAGRLRIKHVLLGTGFVVVCYPFIWALKWEVRAVLAQGVKINDLSAIMTGIVGSLGASGVLQFAGLALLGLLARIQLVSDVVVVFQNSHVLAGEIAHGIVNPFWREGLLGLTLDRLLGIRTPDLGVALADRIDPFHLNNWNVNPGYVGWFFIQPWAIPLLVLYTAVLCWISMYLVKKLAARQTSLDMLWFAWLSYLVPAWLASMVLFTFVLFAFHCLHLVASLYFKWREAFLAPRAAIG
jgi:hypothetical protein